MKWKIFLSTIIFSFLICSCGSSKTPISKEEAEEISNNFSYTPFEKITLDYSCNFESSNEKISLFTAVTNFEINMDRSETSPYYFEQTSIGKINGVINRDLSTINMFESIIDGENYNHGEFAVTPFANQDGMVGLGGKAGCYFNMELMSNRFETNILYKFFQMALMNKLIFLI